MGCVCLASTNTDWDISTTLEGFILSEPAASVQAMEIYTKTLSVFTSYLLMGLSDFSFGTMIV